MFKAKQPVGFKYLINQLQNKGDFTLASDGYSMMPLLQPNDILSFKGIIFSQCNINDLVLVRKNGKIFTHRVIYEAGKYLITKGDNNLVSDGKIYPRQIIGKVYQVKRDVKTFSPEDLYLIQSSLYFAEIVKIKKALEKVKIDFVFLKGLPLHLYYEGAHPRRIYADCDVLVKPQDFDKVRKTLEVHEYQLTNTTYSNIHKILKDKSTEVMFIKKMNNFSVIFDVHFELNFLMNQLGKLDALYNQKYINQLTDDIFKTKTAIIIQNEKFLILDTEYLILYLALHFFHHNFQGEFRLEFLAKLIKNKKINWRNIGSLILNYKLHNFVYPVFLLLKKYYFIHIPKEFIKSINPNEDVRNYIDNNILKINIFDGEPRIGAGINRFKNLFYLSPNPLWKKLMIIFNLQIIYSVIWVVWKKIKRK